MKNDCEKMIKSTNKAEIFGFGGPADAPAGESSGSMKLKEIEAKNASKSAIMSGFKTNVGAGVLSKLKENAERNKAPAENGKYHMAKQDWIFKKKKKKAGNE